MSVQLACRIPEEMNELLEKKRASTGETRYEYMVRLVTQDLQAQPPKKRPLPPPPKKERQPPSMTFEAWATVLQGWWSTGYLPPKLGMDLARKVMVAAGLTVPPDGTEDLNECPEHGCELDRFGQCGGCRWDEADDIPF